MGEGRWPRWNQLETIEIIFINFNDRFSHIRSSRTLSHSSSRYLRTHTCHQQAVKVTNSKAKKAHSEEKSRDLKKKLFSFFTLESLFFLTLSALTPGATFQKIPLPPFQAAMKKVRGKREERDWRQWVVNHRSVSPTFSLPAFMLKRKILSALVPPISIFRWDEHPPAIGDIRRQLKNYQQWGGDGNWDFEYVHCSAVHDATNKFSSITCKWWFNLM